jgi:acetyltransferase-like isoleucine patch superfamily enzyme
MRKIIRYIFKCAGRFLALIYPRVCSLWLKTIRNKIYTFWVAAGFKKCADSSILVYPVTIGGGKYICVGEKGYIGARTVLTAWDEYENDHFNPQIIIGNNVSIGDDCHITAINKIEIGDNVLIGKKITITDNSHGKTEYEQLSIPPLKRSLFSKGPVVIEENVWIGDKATILPGVKIGRNAIIAANAVVTRDIPENCVAGGNPAKVIKEMK